MSDLTAEPCGFLKRFRPNRQQNQKARGNGERPSDHIVACRKKEHVPAIGSVGEGVGGKR